MTKQAEDDVLLESLFKAARTESPKMDDAFLAELLIAADTVAAQNVPAAASPQERKTSTWLEKIMRTVLPASGLTAATALGVWIGVVGPSLDLADAYFVDTDYGIESFLPGAGFDVVSSLENNG